jgi:hypothetical protein
MLELLKIENGLVKVPNTEGNTFLNTERYFTTTLFWVNVDGEDIHTGLPYQKYSETTLGVELEENIVFIDVLDTLIDNNQFTTSDEFINFVFK